MEPVKTDLINALDKFDINDIRDLKRYYVVSQDEDGMTTKKLDVNLLIQSLRKILVIIDKAVELYIYKDFDDNRGYKIVTMTAEEMKAKFKTIILPIKKSTGKGSMSLWDLIQTEQYKKLLRMSRIKFSPQKYDDDSTYYMWHGLQWSVLATPHYRYIRHWLNHVWEIVCNRNYEVCEYVLNWIAKIIQEPRYKTEVALIIKGKHGSGKNTFFTNIIAHLLGNYAIANMTDMNNVIGPFNNMIEFKKLIVVNEAKASDDPMRKYLDNDRLKTTITDETIDINEKHKPQRISDNVLNLIIVSNNDCVNIVDGDRRLLPFTTSNAYAKPEDNDPQYTEIEQRRTEYFDRLTDEIRDSDFYPTLYTYFMKRDVSKFQARRFPQTKERREIIEDNKPPYELFVIDRITDYINGFDTLTAYNQYVTFCNERGFKNPGNVNTFGKNIKEWVDRKRRNTGDRGYYYVMNGEGLKHFRQHLPPTGLDED